MLLFRLVLCGCCGCWGCWKPSQISIVLSISQQLLLKDCRAAKAGGYRRFLAIVQQLKGNG